MKKTANRTLCSMMLMVLSFTLVLAGCANGGKTETVSSAAESSAAESTVSAPGQESYVVGFVPMTLNNEYFITMVNGAKQKAEELGIRLDVQAGDQHANAADQLMIVENMITSGVDAICIVPSSSEGLAQVLKKCKDADVVVINIDTKLDPSILEEAGVKVPFYGTDNYAGGVEAGKYVKENFPPGVKTAILTGIEGQQNAADRRNGFVEGAGDTIEIVAEQSANWEVDQGYAAVQNILTANQDLELIYCGNDGMAIGALRAVQEAKKTDQISIIGFDGVSEALNLVEAGELKGTVAQYPAEMGILGVENAVKILQGQEVEQYINTGVKLILAENVAEHKEYCAKYAN